METPFLPYSGLTVLPTRKEPKDHSLPYMLVRSECHYNSATSCSRLHVIPVSNDGKNTNDDKRNCL